VEEGKEKGVSIVLPPLWNRGKKMESSIYSPPCEVVERKRRPHLLPSLDGRGWGRVILQRRDLIQKLGINDIHHNTGGLTTNKNNFFAGEKDIQCY
jgi:hypothetical protein